MYSQVVYPKFTFDHVHLLSDGTTLLFGWVHFPLRFVKKHLNGVFHSILFSVFHSYAFFHSYTFFIRILFICTFCFIGILFIRILFFIRLLLICILFIRILFIWVLLKPPTTDPPTTDPLTHGPTDHLPFTYRPTDHLPTDPPTDYNQNSLNRRPDSKHVLHFLILENS